MRLAAMVSDLRIRYRSITRSLDERSRRLWAAIEARKLGHGGIAVVASATGMSRSRIERGLQDLRARKNHSSQVPEHGIRRAGGGRKSVIEHDPAVLATLEKIVDPTSRGDPMMPLRWTFLSTRQIAAEFKRQGKALSHEKVARLLRRIGYSLQANIDRKSVV